MAFVNGAESIIIILVIVILFFGAKKIPELARILWESILGISESTNRCKKNPTKNDQFRTPQKSVDREKLESIAETLGVDYTTKNDQDLNKPLNLN